MTSQTTGDQALLLHYLTVKDRWEALVMVCAHGHGTALERLQRDQAEAALDGMKATAGEGQPGDPLCCQRYSRLHHPAFALAGDAEPGQAQSNCYAPSPVTDR